ncbi:MAG TPA: carboxypeptidase-like regulatory domain-containing protein, partial [Luteibaculaceae bacterium]|nr:carboxypeptidase-like regulatory domain-containing protein [Luteibaculaceae bacterium]
MRVVRLFIALAALLLFIPCLWSQTVVTGKVTNTKGEALPITGISVNKGESGTITGEDGRFVLKLAKKKRYLLEVQRLGYIKYEKNFVLENQDTLVLNVTLINSELSEVVVSDRQGASTMKSIDSRFAAGVPSPSGDFLNAVLSSQPGVSMRNELSSSYSVRGGSFDENIVYVNDIEVYRPFLVRSGQQEGLSFINGDMVDRVSFSAGGFEAKYGDKLSSVLDVKYRQPKKFAGSAQLGIMMGSLHLENASKSGKTTYLVGFRYRNNGYVLRSLDTQGEYTPRYLDLQSYLTHQFSKRWSLGFLGNYSSNRFQFIPQTRQTELGSIQQALRFTVFFDGQEITRYRTGLGAVDLQYKVNDDWRIKLIGSHYETRENEEFDIVGQYRLD